MKFYEDMRFQVGDKVKYKGGNFDLPEGAVGEVIYVFLTAKYPYRVRFQETDIYGLLMLEEELEAV